MTCETSAINLDWMFRLADLPRWRRAVFCSLLKRGKQRAMKCIPTLFEQKVTVCTFYKLHTEGLESLLQSATHSLIINYPSLLHT